MSFISTEIPIHNEKYSIFERDCEMLLDKKSQKIGEEEVLLNKSGANTNGNTNSNANTTSKKGAFERLKRYTCLFFTNTQKDDLIEPFAKESLRRSLQ